MDRVCIVGSFMMDLALRAPRRPRAGETVLGTGFEIFLGGKGFNQAVAASRSGAQSAMVGRLGRDDFGKQFLDRMQIEQIDASNVGIDDDEGTGIGVPLVEDSGENSIVVVPRANARLTAQHIAQAANAISCADVLLLQLELPIEAVVAAAKIAHDAGVLVVLNPAPARVEGHIEQLRGCIDVLVPNESEAHALAGGREGMSNLDIVHDLAARLSAAVVMTVGGSGCLVADADGVFTVEAHSVQVVDTVGAGDAFCGALGASLATGASLRDAVVYANAAGALAVTLAGAEPSMPHRDAVLQLVASRNATHR